MIHDLQRAPYACCIFFYYLLYTVFVSHFLFCYCFFFRGKKLIEDVLTVFNKLIIVIFAYGSLISMCIILRKISLIRLCYNSRNVFYCVV